ncbi:MAG: hypothetical protein ACAH10_12105, partial [Methylophilaceae bacterium]
QYRSFWVGHGSSLTGFLTWLCWKIWRLENLTLLLLDGGFTFGDVSTCWDVRESARRGDF